MFYNFEIKYQDLPPRYLSDLVFDSEFDRHEFHAPTLLNFDLETKYYLAWHELTLLQFNAVTRHLNGLIEQNKVVRYRVEEREKVGSDEMGVSVHVYPWNPDKQKPVFNGFKINNIRRRIKR